MRHSRQESVQGKEERLSDALNRECVAPVNSRATAGFAWLQPDRDQGTIVLRDRLAAAFMYSTCTPAQRAGCKADSAEVQQLASDQKTLSSMRANLSDLNRNTILRFQLLILGFAELTGIN